MKARNTMAHAIWLVGGLALIAIGTTARAEQIFQRERDIPDLHLGQRAMVDDGTCPAGQIKQVIGSNLTATGITRTSKCVPRLGAKKKK
jgi:hypothetical protein